MDFQWTLLAVVSKNLLKFLCYYRPYSFSLLTSISNKNSMNTFSYRNEPPIVSQSTSGSRYRSSDPGYGQVYAMHLRLAFFQKKKKKSYCHHLFYNLPRLCGSHTDCPDKFCQ